MEVPIDVPVGVIVGVTSTEDVIVVVIVLADSLSIKISTESLKIFGLLTTRHQVIEVSITDVFLIQIF